MTRRLNQMRSTLAVLCAVVVAFLGMQTAHATVDRFEHGLGIPHAADPLAGSLHFDIHQDGVDSALSGQDHHGGGGAENDDGGGSPLSHHHDNPPSLWLTPTAAVFGVFLVQRAVHHPLNTRASGLGSAPPEHPPKPDLDAIA